MLCGGYDEFFGCKWLCVVDPVLISEDLEDVSGVVFGFLHPVLSAEFGGSIVELADDFVSWERFERECVSLIPASAYGARHLVFEHVVDECDAVE